MIKIVLYLEVIKDVITPTTSTEGQSLSDHFNVTCNVTHRTDSKLTTGPANIRVR